MFFTVGNVIRRNNTDDEFRQWGKMVSDALASLGLVKTADTGQINWASVARPTSTSQSMGYEIWRFNDALQSTSPIFFKLEYGGSPSSASAPAMWVTPGQGSNGSGTITVNAGSTYRRIIQTDTPVVATTYTSYFSSNTGQFVMGLWSESTQSQVFGIERSNDTAGVSTDSYFTTIVQANQLTQPKIGESPGWDSHLRATPPALLGTIDQKRPVFEQRPYLGGWGKPLTLVMGIDGNQWANESYQNFNVQIYGKTYIYKVLPYISDDNLAIRWE